MELVGTETDGWQRWQSSRELAKQSSPSIRKGSLEQQSIRKGSRAADNIRKSEPEENSRVEDIVQQSRAEESS